MVRGIDLLTVVGQDLRVVLPPMIWCWKKKLFSVVVTTNIFTTRIKGLTIARYRTRPPT